MTDATAISTGSSVVETAADGTPLRHPDRPVPPLAERDALTKLALSADLDEWAKSQEERRSVWGSGYSIHEEIEDPSKKTGIKSVGKKL